MSHGRNNVWDLVVKVQNWFPYVKLVPICSKLVPTGPKMENCSKLTADVICAWTLCENKENESRNKKYMMYEI